MQHSPHRWRFGEGVVLGLVAAVVLAGTGFQARASPDPPRAATTPVFMSLDPDGGEYLRGGSPYYIQWNVTHDGDSDLYTMIDYSTDSGATYPYRIAAGNFSTYGAYVNWSVPMIDATTVRVQVCVYPLDGHTACRASFADFTIDSTPPYLVMTSPSDGQVNVPLTAPLVFVFSEPMVRSSVYWMIAPSVTLVPSWSTDNATLTLTPAVPWQSCVMYTITIGGQDRAGWPLASGPVPNPWSFTTACPGPYIVSTDPVHNETNVVLTAPIVVTFSELMNETSVQWGVSPSVRLVPAWATGSDLWLDPRETFSRYNVSMNPNYYTGGSYGAWMCSQVPPNQIVLQPVGVVTSRTVDVHITSPNPGDDHDLQIWLDTDDNGVCDDIVDTLLCQSADADADEQCVASTTDGTKRIFVQVGPFLPGSDTYHVNILDLWLYQACTPHTAQIVQGQDLNGNPLIPGPVPNPWAFTTDCGLPYVASTVPSDGAANVSLTASLGITFSESMNTTSVVVTVLPPVGNISLVWPAGYLLSVRHDPLSPCTSYLVSVTGSDPDGNLLVPGPVPNPWTFTTICPRPFIVSTDPPDGLQGAFRDAPVVVTFSEVMNASTVLVTFVANVTGISPSWSSGGTVLTVTHQSFQRCLWYTVTVSGESSLGLSLVPGPVPNPWSFQVSCATVAVALLAPLGGESWTGNTSHSVSFEVYSGLPAGQAMFVSAVYRYLGGASGGTIGSQTLSVPPGSTIPGQFSWNPPMLDARDIVVNLTATASPAGDVVWAESNPFEIDSTPPVVVSGTPAGSHAPVDPVVGIQFSEPMGLQTSGLPVVVPSVGVAATWGPARDFLQLTLTGTSRCTAYTVTVGGPGGTMRDDSDPGNPLAPYAWSFTTQCLPTAALLVPVGGEDWTGGAAHMVSWTLADADDPMLTVSLLLSLDGGSTFAPFGTPMSYPTGAGAASWSLPLADTASAVLRLVAADSDGNTATDDSPPFTIDSTPPAILTSYPLDGGSGFKTTRQVWFVFTERVDRASFESAFSISPNPGGLSLYWSVVSGYDVLTVDHAPFKSKTAYTVTFGTAARDDSDPGNHPSAPLLVRFNTQPPPNVTPPVAKAVGKNQVQVGEPVTLDGRGSTGNLSSYVWRIVDNQGGLVNVLVGAVATHTFQQNGRYSVTLIVTDVNGLSDDDTLEIAVTSNPHSDGYLLAGGILFAAALAAATESGKYGLFGWILFPLYVRRKRNEALEHQTRGMILGYVMVHPGDTYTDIKRNLVLSNGTLSYHLRVMEREGLIRSQTKGPHKHFFPLGVRVPEDGGGLHEIQMRMLGAVREVPGLAVKDIAGALGITSQHALYHLRALAAKGLVRLEKRGFNLRCYAEPPRMP